MRQFRFKSSLVCMNSGQKEQIILKALFEEPPHVTMSLSSRAD